MIDQALKLEEAARDCKDVNKKKELLVASSAEFLRASKKDNSNQKKYLAKAIELYEQSNKLKMVHHQVEKSDRIDFTSIGGLDSLKEEIRIKIIEPILNPEIFKQFGKKAGGGILMYGPPGCGKSLIAEATANEANASFYHVKPSELKSKYVGETEKNISKLFEQARENQPAIIFFDEFETLGRERSRTDVHTQNHISQLLSEMDGVGNKDSQILLLAATNVPWDIDPALRRHGRFGTSIFVHEPDLLARKEIIKLNLQDKPIDDSVDVEFLANVTDGFSGADISELCEIAADIVIKEFFKTKNKRNINHQDFITALEHKQTIVKSWYDLAKKKIIENQQEDLYSDIMAR